MTRPAVLILLLVLLVAAGYYAWQASPQPQHLVAREAEIKHSSQKKVLKLADERENLDFSGGQKHPFKPPVRDLFRPLYRPPKPETRPVVVSPLPSTPAPAPIREIQPPPAPVRPRESEAFGPKPIPNFKILGFLQQEGERQAFLASQTGEIYVLKQGQRFADDLLVRELTGDKIVLSRGLTDPGRTLLFSGAKPQRIKVIGGPPSRPDVPIPPEFNANTLMPRRSRTQQAESGEAGEEKPADQ